ncbi:hypothetical protein UG55_11385 [Frankia sp. EI5c]|nr:hypothetical protein UG55_11385 [Frankia sp. EI5c]
MPAVSGVGGCQAGAGAAHGLGRRTGSDGAWYAAVGLASGAACGPRGVLSGVGADGCEARARG